MSEDRLFDLDTFAAVEGKEEQTVSRDPVERRPPADQTDRDRIQHELDATLFVEAGAGSGKTTALVGRILELVTAPSPVALRNIAAITFTEKAAGELRDRLRRDLEVRLDDALREHSPHADALANAIGDLDGAAISTLHAFAQRILSEHPVEAGLPPTIEVLDEISSQVAFEHRWAEQLDRLLDDPDLAEPILLAYAAGIDERHLRDLAVAFNDNWDLVASRLPPPPSVRLKTEPIVEAGRSLLHRRIECRFPDDTMLAPLAVLESFLDRLERSRDDAERLALLTQATRSNGGLPKVGNKGKKDNWDDVGSVRSEHRALLDSMTEERARTVDAVIKVLAEAIGRFTIEAAADRRVQGRLEFHDLLVQARELLRSPVHGAEVRVALRNRYQRLLLDEFQDTDPIQIELAVLLASVADSDPAAAWNEIDVEPGRLFFVGDPKQSIYRFRRADIGLFLEARAKFGAPPVRLTTNFRSSQPIIDWVNATFGTLIEPSAASQPEYEPLTSHRGVPPAGPGVMVVGQEPHEGDLQAEPLRDLEASDIAAAITAAMTEQWPVREESTDEWRAPRLGDITILLPARTSLPALERALDAAGIPHRAETSSLVWSTREIRDLMMCLRAVDDPTDELALVSALRSAVYGCGDDDLYRYRRVHGGVWSHQHRTPDSLPPDDPVAEAMTHLSELHARRMWATPSELLQALISERKVFEQGIAKGRPRDVWRRLRFVLDQARAYGDSEGGSLREFLRWAQLQSAEGARVSETVLPETDDDSVRIMTIHGSKGLEFPITMVSGLTTRPASGRRGVVAAFPPDGSEAVIRLGSALETKEYEWFVPIDEQMGHHERLRLLYVACTRAQDHLVVSLHRKAPPKTTPEEHRRTSADLLAMASVENRQRSFVRSVSSTGWSTVPSAVTPVRVPDLATWRAQRAEAFTAGTRARSLSATSVADAAIEQLPAEDPGLDKEARDLDLPPWMKGRFGTAIGRAVHGVLQTIDLATGDGLQPLVAAQAAAEGVIGREETIAALVQSALDSDIVKQAARGRHWRETYVGTPIGDTVIEGYIDLLYEHPDGGVVVVDHKTDAVPDEASLAAKADRYRLQAATYAFAVERTTGLRVRSAALLFLAPDGAVPFEIVNLEAAVAEVKSIVEAVAADG